MLYDVDHHEETEMRRPSFCDRRQLEFDNRE
jgi:hypothetical protein